MFTRAASRDPRSRHGRAATGHSRRRHARFRWSRYSALVDQDAARSGHASSAHGQPFDNAETINRSGGHNPLQVVTPVEDLARRIPRPRQADDRIGQKPAALILGDRDPDRVELRLRDLHRAVTRRAQHERQAPALPATAPIRGLGRGPILRCGLPAASALQPRAAHAVRLHTSHARPNGRRPHRVAAWEPGKSEASCWSPPLAHASTGQSEQRVLVRFLARVDLLAVPLRFKMPPPAGRRRPRHSPFSQLLLTPAAIRGLRSGHLIRRGHIATTDQESPLPRVGPPASLSCRRPLMVVSEVRHTTGEPCGDAWSAGWSSCCSRRRCSLRRASTR